MKIIFMGTPDFAVPTLKKLYENQHEILAVVTKPDQKRGRGKKVTFSPVKELALEMGTEVLQPEKIKGNKEFTNKIKLFNPDVIVVVAYGKILPSSILDMPHYGCINIHGSLLPEYRGAAPIHWALVHGKKTTGVTTMLMDTGMDTGDILLKREIPIESQDDVLSLHVKLSELGADLLLETLNMLAKDNISPVKQDNSLATYAPMITKDMGEIKWDRPAKELHNLIKGLNPWPGCYSYLNGERLKLHKCQILQKHSFQEHPGIISDISQEGISVNTGYGKLLLTVVQPPSKPKMDAFSFANGYKLNVGDKFEYNL